MSVWATTEQVLMHKVQNKYMKSILRSSSYYFSYEVLNMDKILYNKG